MNPLLNSRMTHHYLFGCFVSTDKPKLNIICGYEVSEIEPQTMWWIHTSSHFFLKVPFHLISNIFNFIYLVDEVSEAVKLLGAAIRLTKVRAGTLHQKREIKVGEVKAHVSILGSPFHLAHQGTVAGWSLAIDCEHIPPRRGNLLGKKNTTGVSPTLIMACQIIDFNHVFCYKLFATMQLLGP